MLSREELLQTLEDARADLAAAEDALPPLPEMETAAREALELAVDRWRQFEERLAGQIAGSGKVRLREACGGVDVSPDLVLGAAIAAHGVDKMVARAMKAAEKHNPHAVRLDAAEKCEAVSALRHQRYALESELARLHFENGDRLPDDCHPGALLGIPVEVVESVGPLNWED